MKRICLVALAIIVGFVQSCTRQEADVPESAVTLTVGEYPVFSESKALGIPDPGKSEWQDGDVLYIVLQTAENPVAARYRVTRVSGGWKFFEKYEDGNYTTVVSMTVPGACRALAFYAPAYEFKGNSVLALQSGKKAGLDEFMQWSSGEDYNITGNVALSITFVKDYSRLRIVTEANYTAKMKASTFVPAGYNTSALGTLTLTATADGNANAFYYGTWPKGCSFDVTTYDTDGEYAFNNTFMDKPASVNGTSYALNCQDSGDYTTLAELSAMATSSGKNFNVTLRNAVVSYAIGKYAHIEDGSGAIMVYLNDHGLETGQCINGTVSGKVKLYETYAQIISLDCTSATITGAAYLPLTEMTLADLLADYKANISRRILLKDITIDKGISSGTSTKREGKISQNGSTIQIYGTYTPSPAVLETGLTGDLIAFPVLKSGTKQLSIYVADQFTEGSGGDPEDTAFARLMVKGFYSNTDTDNPTAVLTYAEGADQYSFGTASGKSFYHQLNLENGTYAVVNLDVSSYKIGSEFAVSTVLNGVNEDHTVKVVNKNSSMAWLEDKTNNVGYIIALK